jgi:hypothetical protein
MLGIARQSSTDPAILKPGTLSDFVYGGGIRVDVEHMFSRSFGLRAHGEVMGLGENASVDINENVVLWTGAGIWGSATVGLLGRF